jgi:prophage antirepressor-like protein
MENKIGQEFKQEFMEDKADFSINRWFNKLPIRIVGSPEKPFFYASDIGTVLGLQRIGMSLKNFDETEIVTPETRLQYNIVTYRKYKDQFRRDDSITLLTEYGVYRLIINSRSEIASEFKKYIYKLIEETRQADRNKLKTIDPEDFEELKNKVAKLERMSDEYQKYNPSIFVFTKKVNGNPYEHILAKDKDEYIEQYFDETCEVLYKFTTKPCPEDYTKYTMCAKIYGDSEQIMDDLSEHCLDIEPMSLRYCRYIMDFDLSIIEARVVYHKQ